MPCVAILSRVGMDLATVQVRVENLKVEADIAVGSRGNPTVTNTLRDLAEVGLASVHRCMTTQMGLVHSCPGAHSRHTACQPVTNAAVV